MSFNAILSLESTSAAPQSRPPSSIPTDSNTVTAPTPRHLGPDAVIETTIHAIVEHKAQVPEAARLRAVGLVVPGVVDAQQGIAVYAANIGWQQLPYAR